MRTVSAYKNGQLLLKNVLWGDSFFTNFKGLMGKKELPPDSAMMLLKCNSIHTFFMHFPIGVVYLSSDYVITSITPHVRQRRLSSDRKARHTLEMYPATLKKLGLKIGDQLHFSE